MIPAKFDYFAPTTLQEAIGLLLQHGEEGKILAGGQSLIPAMRFRLAQPEVLIDINRIDGLEYIREVEGYLAIGALTRESALDHSALIRQKYPLLADTVGVIADPLVRNMATVGGNIAHADPANDHPATMLCYNARMVADGPNGRRTIAVDDFFVDLFETALEKNEILTEIQIPTPPERSGGAYIKLERKVGDYAVVGVATQLSLAEDGETVKELRIGLTNVSGVPMRAKQAEGTLNGKALNDALLEAAGQAAAAECDPSPDLRGNEDYKRDMVRVLVKRAIRKAARRARGEI
ncbi:MAG TPA: xanthine dehydrogenase family protein subunit M [Chloroflexia bacterium]|nr:xanthine dehydrogenase family protein subunit M [Chloroflexia bacterium]